MAPLIHWQDPGFLSERRKTDLCKSLTTHIIEGPPEPWHICDDAILRRQPETYFLRTRMLVATLCCAIKTANTVSNTFGRFQTYCVWIC
mmetsp:Transcript_2147/g.14165  ORF Transcript_2147/g.14165 Transcript_2147/m.14165 type:complete len:89 (+) Transcript_2147:4025-4291(+)